MSNLKTTPLYQYHLALNAKMVPFAGYHMPVKYPSGTIKEHLHCRSQTGFFDISHMGQCLVNDENMTEQLDRLVPSNIKSLAIGQQRYTVLTNSEGGIIDDIVISRLESGLMIVVNAACKEADFAYLQSKLNGKVDILPDQALFALQGPSAKDIMLELSASACDLSFMQVIKSEIEGIECIISRSGYCGEDGFEISVASQFAQKIAELILSFQQVEAIGLGARDTLRLEAGLSLYGHELNTEISPVEAGLSWLIDKNKQDYPGAEKINQQLRQGAPRKRVGFVVDGKIPVREQHQIFTENDSLVGKITSGGFSPSLNIPIAMGLIEKPCAETTLYATIRNKKIAMQVTPLPFVPHRYHRG